MDRAADFFVSYTSTDRAWAEWIAWQLEADGYKVVVQAWDFTPPRLGPRDAAGHRHR
jgi:TIR domain